MSPARHPVRALEVGRRRATADQVADNVKRYIAGTLPALCRLYGGADMDPQTQALRTGVERSHSGRLLDHLQSKNTSLGQCRWSCSTRPTACSTWGFA
jgi:superfamily II DNA/RNA helicase